MPTVSWNECAFCNESGGDISRTISCRSEPFVEHRAENAEMQRKQIRVHTQSCFPSVMLDKWLKHTAICVQHWHQVHGSGKKGPATTSAGTVVKLRTYIKRLVKRDVQICHTALGLSSTSAFAVFKTIYKNSTWDAKMSTKLGMFLCTLAIMSVYTILCTKRFLRLARGLWKQ